MIPLSESLKGSWLVRPFQSHGLLWSGSGENSFSGLETASFSPLTHMAEGRGEGREEEGRGRERRGRMGRGGKGRRGEDSSVSLLMKLLREPP